LPVAGVIAVALVFLTVPALVGIPAHLIDGCATWIGLAGGLEVLSALGFVVTFKLVFGARMTWRESAPAGLRALGATTILPAGGLIGPAAGARSAKTEDLSAASLTRSTITFVALTNAPGLIVLVVLGPMLWLGWPSGPHDAALALIPAALALAVLTVGWRSRSSGGAPDEDRPIEYRGLRRLARPVAILRDGVAEVRHLSLAGDWKLIGALGYYAFDNAVLWAAFHAYGRTPPVSVIVMGYLIGSVASALPSPGGLGVLEGGLIGALVLYGAPAAPAAGAVLLYRSVSLGVPVLLGALAWAGRPAAWLRARRETSGRPESAEPSLGLGA
jgi:uncharacterized membrane protein YbhN (UPF0104 family)